MTFKQKLESQEAEEGASITLNCELSKPGVPVEWKKGTQVLKSGEKYQLKQKASVNELLINKVVPEDSGEYSCVCGDQKTTANICIKGRKRIFRAMGVLYNFLSNISFVGISILKSLYVYGLHLLSVYDFVFVYLCALYFLCLIQLHATGY